MTLQEALAILTRHQQWQKDNSLFFSPKDLTEAIDIILAYHHVGANEMIQTNKTMTAVEWFDEQIQERIIAQDVVARKLIIEISMEDYMGIKKQANKMFEQQIIDALNIDKRQYDNAQQYYNDKYGSKGSDDKFDVLKEMFELELPINNGSDESGISEKQTTQTERMFSKEEVMDAIRMARQINYLNQDYEIMLSIKLK